MKNLKKAFPDDNCKKCQILFKEKCKKIFEKDKDAFIKRGITLSKLERYEDAIICFDKAIELDKDGSSIWWGYKGSLLYDLKRFEEAITCMF